jgi:hypothetical protein
LKCVLAVVDRMKLLPVALTLLFLTLLTPTPARSTTVAEEVSFEYFYDALYPYGHWIEVEGYGSCWTPDRVDADWAPYTNGDWVYTNGGWTWIGEEDFSGIVYHYGRWILVDDVGWCWVPGYVWGPAWVAWRDGEDYIGWAPLPPEATWELAVGIGVWVDDYCDIGPSYYHFCRRSEFGFHHARFGILPRERNMILMHESRNVTNIAYSANHDVVFCGGPSYERLGGVVRRRIPFYQLENGIPSAAGDAKDRHALPPRGVVSGGSLVFIAPPVAAHEDGRTHHAKAVKVLAASSVHRGWNGMGDKLEQESMRKKIHAETQGKTPQNAPARPIIATELKPVQPVTSQGRSTTMTAQSLRYPGAAGAVSDVAVPEQAPLEPAAPLFVHPSQADMPPAGKGATITPQIRNHEAEMELNRQNEQQKRLQIQRTIAENATRQQEALRAKAQMEESRRLQRIAQQNATFQAQQQAAEEASRHVGQHHQVQEMPQSRQNAPVSQPRQNVPQPQPVIRSENPPAHHQTDEHKSSHKKDDDDRRKKN